LFEELNQIKSNAKELNELTLNPCNHKNVNETQTLYLTTSEKPKRKRTYQFKQNQSQY